jgi:hypothetical protein
MNRLHRNAKMRGIAPAYGYSLQGNYQKVAAFQAGFPRLNPTWCEGSAFSGFSAGARREAAFAGILPSAQTSHVNLKFAA